MRLESMTNPEDLTLAEAASLAGRAGWTNFQVRPVWPFRFLLMERKGEAFFEQPPLVQLPNTQVNKDTFTWRFLQLSGQTGAGGTGSMRYPF